MPESTERTQIVGESDLDRVLLDDLVQTAFVMTGLLSRLAGRHDLSLTQLRLLGILRDRQPKMAELADHLGLERSTVSGLIDRAVARGLVERLPDAQDARAAQVALTVQGKQLATTAAGEIAEDATFLIDALSMTDRRRLAGLLRRLCEAEASAGR